MCGAVTAGDRRGLECEGEACNIAQAHRTIKPAVSGNCQCNDNQSNRHTFHGQYNARGESEHLTDTHETRLHNCCSLMKVDVSQERAKPR